VEENGVKTYGHRGASKIEPENTLRSFQRALDMGVDGIELDVQVTTDRVPVILHDRNLGRTTNRSGPVDFLSLEELRCVDAGKGEGVPTFAEVLELVGDRAHIDIEIKQGGIEREVLEVLAAYPRSRWAISSFDWTTLECVRELSATADLWLLAILISDALFTTARDLKASAISLYAPGYTPSSAGALRTAGLDAVIWTVNEVAEAQRVRDLGAMGLCTDVPDVIMAGLAVRTNK